MGLFHISLANGLLLLTIVISLANIGIGLLWIFEEVMATEMFSGWLVSYVNHVLQSMINKISRIKKYSKMIFLGMGLHGLRVGLFLIVVLGVLIFSGFQVVPFMYALFCTYFLFLFYDILNLHFTSLKTYQ